MYGSEKVKPLSTYCAYMSIFCVLAVCSGSKDCQVPCHISYSFNDTS